MTDPDNSHADGLADKAGIASILLASSCCVLPVALAALGLGGLGLGSFFGTYHWNFLAGAAAALAAAWGLHLRRQPGVEGGGCVVNARRRSLQALTAATVLVIAIGTVNGYTWLAGRSAGVEETTRDAPPAGLSQIVLPVEGMSCYSCGIVVEGSLREVDGVSEAVASVPEGSVRVTYDAHRVGVGNLVQAVDRTGFRAAAPSGAS